MRTTSVTLREAWRDSCLLTALDFSRPGLVLAGFVTHLGHAVFELSESCFLAFMI